jgi:hypothetical protein
MALVCATSPAAADSWDSQTDAITKLWNGRLTNGRGWPVGSCDNYNGLPPQVQEVTSNTQSGLVVPQLTIRSQRLTNNVAAIARALLGTDLTSSAQNAFFPTDPDADGPIVMNDAFWAANLRSSHADEFHRLPAPGGALPDPPQNCPAGLAVLGRLDTLRALNSAPVNVALTNRVKWHCYANRYRMVGDVDVGIPGFVEITHFEYGGQASQYPYAESRGRFVFDYVNKRVYYTPAHYHPWYKANFNPVGDGDHPGANTTCNPFFEIVP